MMEELNDLRSQRRMMHRSPVQYVPSVQMQHGSLMRSDGPSSMSSPVQSMSPEYGIFIAATTPALLKMQHSAHEAKQYTWAAAFGKEMLEAQRDNLGKVERYNELYDKFHGGHVLHSSSCIVCLKTEPVNAVFAPCMHAVMCQSCANQQLDGDYRRKCPTCRLEGVESRRLIFDNNPSQDNHQGHDGRARAAASQAAQPREAPAEPQADAELPVPESAAASNNN